MIRVFGEKTLPTVEKVSDGVYIVRWDYEPIDDDQDHCMYVYEYMYGNISIEDIKILIINWYNDQTDYKILNGFYWDNKPVYLSTENQFNFKAAYDLAIQTNGSNLPVTFKLGEINNEAVYYTFETVEELNEFYTKAVSHINKCLNDGWQKKDLIDWDNYKIPEDK